MENYEFIISSFEITYDHVQSAFVTITCKCLERLQTDLEFTNLIRAKVRMAKSLCAKILLVGVQYKVRTRIRY